MRYSLCNPHSRNTNVTIVLCYKEYLARYLLQTQNLVSQVVAYQLNLRLNLLLWIVLCNWLYYTTCLLLYIIKIVYFHFYNCDNLFVIITRGCCIVPKFSKKICTIVFVSERKFLFCGLSFSLHNVTPLKFHKFATCSNISMCQGYLSLFPPYYI